MYLLRKCDLQGLLKFSHGLFTFPQIFIESELICPLACMKLPGTSRRAAALNREKLKKREALYGKEESSGEEYSHDELEINEGEGDAGQQAQQPAEKKRKMTKDEVK